MCPIISDDGICGKRGRPSLGSESRSIERKIRLEPYLDEKIGYVSRLFGISKSEVIRQGIIMYLNHAEKIIYGGKENE